MIKKKSIIFILVLSLLIFGILIFNAWLWCSTITEFYQQITISFIWVIAITFIIITLLGVLITIFTLLQKYRFLHRFLVVCFLLVGCMVGCFSVFSFFRKKVNIYYPHPPFSVEALLTFNEDLMDDYYLLGIQNSIEISYFHELFIKLDPHFEILKEEEEILYDGVLAKELSMKAAIVSAYREASFPLAYQYLGEVIVAKYPFLNQALTLGDTIIAINNQPLIKPDDFLTYYQLALENGDPNIFVKVVTRNQEFKSITLDFQDVDGQKMLGLGHESDYRILSPTIVNVNEHNNSNGPSGGLLMSLAIYHTLNKIDLVDHVKIGATGTITANGIVGKIGGIKQKVISAAAADLDIMFIPQENREEAMSVLEMLITDLKIVPVASLSEAIAYLEDYRA